MDWYLMSLMADQAGLFEALRGLGSTLWVIASVALTLGFVIFVHELGHFLAAKACGVKCEKFYIGFDVPMGIGPVRLPAALWRVQWGETEYGIGSLPLGGYVKMLGQDDNPTAQSRENERIRVRKPAPTEQPAIPGEAPGASEPDSARAAATDDASDDQAVELDPRSFPAKPVWQRMIIISAGVVMNLIFAVVFAAVAYGMGVRYVPSIIGDTVAGSPAWREGIGPQDQVLQIGRRGQPDEQLRFRRDLMPQVVLNGGESPLEMLLRRRGQSQPEWISIQPVNRHQQALKAFAERPLIGRDDPRTAAREEALKMLPRTASLGVTSIGTTVVSPLMASEAYGAIHPAFEPLQGGDEIVAVDGVPLPRDEVSGQILATDLEAQLARRVTEPVTLTIQRAAGEDRAAEEFDITLPPQPMRMLGMSMATGPIASVRRGTPADRAGLREGDRLITIDGESLGDPLTLPQRLLALAGREVEVQYEREGRRTALRLTPELPETLGEPLMYGAMLPLESLGVALPLHNVVADVDPEGPAFSAGVQPGDEILSVQLMLEDEEKLAQATELFPTYEQPIYLDHALPYWNYVHLIVQRTLPGTSLRLSLLRDVAADQAAAPQMLTVTLTPVESETWNTASRGLILSSLTQVRTSDSWRESWLLGYRETGESVTQVVRVLHGLLTGTISWTNLGGPITIAAAAGYEAAEGFSQLLIFLTLLSANLAVLNFLPIPALDGGHMVFLAAEGVRGKPVDERLQVMLTVIGVVFLLGLIVILSIKDVGTLLRLLG